MGVVAVRDGQIKSFEQVRCVACNRLLCRIDCNGLKPGKGIEIKCKCDAVTYRFGESTS